MRSIYGDNLGDTVDFRTVGPYTVTHPWPPKTAVSAGRGLVFVRGTGDSYTTLFMGVYPPGASFIRGEGPRRAHRPRRPDSAVPPGTSPRRRSHTPPAWEPRGYVNGAGFCRHCNTFCAGCFTGEQLGQFCAVCGVGTTYSNRESVDGGQEFFCEEHSPAPELPEWMSGFYGE